MHCGHPREELRGLVVAELEEGGQGYMSHTLIALWLSGVEEQWSLNFPTRTVSGWLG